MDTLVTTVVAADSVCYIQNKFIMALNIKDLRIVSSAFNPLERIPKRYTSDGENISPPLEWSGLPSVTQQLALNQFAIRNSQFAITFCDGDERFRLQFALPNKKART